MMEDDDRERFDISHFFELQRADLLAGYMQEGIKEWDYAELMDCLRKVKSWALRGDAHFEVALEALTQLIDRQYPTYDKKRRSILQMVNQTLETIFPHFPTLDMEESKSGYRLISWHTR
jgi:hypothetical protein